MQISISDHANIIKFDNRPFADLNEMHSVIVDNWNRVVRGDDTVYILGDFCWAKESEWPFYLGPLADPDCWMLYGHVHTTREYDFMEKLRQEVKASMTKYLFANYRLKMYSYLNHSLRTGALRSIIGVHFTSKVLNKESCCFPGVSFWRIDRTSFWADVEVALHLNTASGSCEWRGVLSLWCSFDDVFSCSIEELCESIDRRAEGMIY